MRKGKLSAENLDRVMNWIDDVVSGGCEKHCEMRGLTDSREREAYELGFRDSARFICELVCEAEKVR